MYSDRTGSGEQTQTAGWHEPDRTSQASVDMGRVVRDEAGEVHDLVHRARGRSDGFHYGDDRAIGATPNWAARESKQLYAYATVNNEPGTAEELGQTWNRHGGELSRIADELYNAIAELGAAWVGQGAGAAQGALVGIANSSSQASEAAIAMRERLGQQASAAAKLKTMPQPKEFDPGAETASMLAGGPAAMIKDMKEQHDAAQAVKAQQIAFLDAYTTELSEIDSTTPSFGPESLGLKNLGDGVSVEAARLGAVGPYAVSGGDAGGLSPRVSAGPAIGAGGADAVSAGGGADTASSRPATVSGVGSPVASGQAGPAPSGGGLNVGQSLGAAAAGGVLGYAGAKGLSKGRRSASKNDVENVETVASSNQTGSASASAVPPNQVAGNQVTPQMQNQVIAASGGVVGAPTPAGSAGGPMGGMGGMGAAAGRSDEEKEHTHASFLIEPDPDDTFGATEAAAPPVLGAWGPEDEGR